MTARHSFWCIVPAAGRGIRFGGDLPKQYQLFGGVPLLLVTLRRLATHPSIAGLVVVLAPDDEHWPKLGQLDGKPVLTAEGGEQRADSVLAGLRVLRDSALVSENEWVLVHDAARPCISHHDIDRLIEGSTRHAYGGLLACPIRDTLKRVSGNGTLQSLGTDANAREELWRAQTPQMFRLTELIENLMSAIDGSSPANPVTDEASAYEHNGCFPLIVEGSAANIKVTTADDLHIALRLATG